MQNSVFEHNASFAPDGNSVLFTSERNGAGQSDVFRARLDGTDIEPVATGPAVEDQAALSPDGTRVAFISTREGYRANVWVLDLKSGAVLPGNTEIQHPCTMCSTLLEALRSLPMDHIAVSRPTQLAATSSSLPPISRVAQQSRLEILSPPPLHWHIADSCGSLRGANHRSL